MSEQPLTAAQWQVRQQLGEVLDTLDPEQARQLTEALASFITSATAVAEDRSEDPHAMAEMLQSQHGAQQLIASVLEVLSPEQREQLAALGLT